MISLLNSGVLDVPLCYINSLLSPVAAVTVYCELSSKSKKCHKKVKNISRPRIKGFPRCIVGQKTATAASVALATSPANDDKLPLIKGANIHLSSHYVCFFPPLDACLCCPGMHHLFPSNTGDTEQCPPHAAVSQC